MQDEQFLNVTKDNPNLLVPWYLMASYLYYVCDESLLSDVVFDQLCKRLIAEWDNIEHFHKNIISFAELSAGTCFLTDKQYPNRVKSAAKSLLELNPELILESTSCNILDFMV